MKYRAAYEHKDIEHKQVTESWSTKLEGEDHQEINDIDSSQRREVKD